MKKNEYFKEIEKIYKEIKIDIKKRLEEFKNISDVFEEDVYQAIDVNTCVNKRNTIGACGQEMMKKVIALNEEYLKQF